MIRKLLFAPVQICLLVWAQFSFASDDIPKAAMPIFAITKIFVAKDHIRQTISLLNEQTANLGDHLRIVRPSLTGCIFNLERDGVLAQSVDFSALTSEYSVGWTGHYYVARFWELRAKKLRATSIVKYAQKTLSFC